MSTNCKRYLDVILADLINVVRSQIDRDLQPEIEKDPGFLKLTWKFMCNHTQRNTRQTSQT